MSATTPFTPAVLTVAHPQWCDPAACRPAPDWSNDGYGYVLHIGVLLDAPGLRVEVQEGEVFTAQGALCETDAASVVVEAIPDELTPEQATQLGDALVRGAALAGGAQ